MNKRGTFSIPLTDLRGGASARIPENLKIHEILEVNPIHGFILVDAEEVSIKKTPSMELPKIEKINLVGFLFELAFGLICTFLVVCLIAIMWSIYTGSELYQQGNNVSRPQQQSFVDISNLSNIIITGAQHSQKKVDEIRNKVSEQGGAVAARLAHNQEVVGANPTPATKMSLTGGQGVASFATSPLGSISIKGLDAFNGRISRTGKGASLSLYSQKSTSCCFGRSVPSPLGRSSFLHLNLKHITKGFLLMLKAGELTLFDDMVINGSYLDLDNDLDLTLTPKFDIAKNETPESMGKHPTHDVFANGSHGKPVPAGVAWLGVRQSGKNRGKKSLDLELEIRGREVRVGGNFPDGLNVVEVNFYRDNTQQAVAS